MYLKPMTRVERDEIHETAVDLLRERVDALMNNEEEKALRLRRRVEALKAEYFDRLPVPAMSTCPYCERPFLRSFDRFGFDGDWWLDGSTRPAPIPCRHFCVLRGAVHLGDFEVIGGKAEIFIGPEVPYVIPRILDLEDMIAVIGELEMEPGYRVYPITYFADPRPPIQELTADWPNKNFNWTTQMGERGWRYPVDPWDFDLAPWIETGKLRWCKPGSENEVLAFGGPEDCPYLDLPGQRAQLFVTGPYVSNRGLPDGQPIGPND